jgi:hypothetical protein
MLTDEVTVEAPQLLLPPELLAEVSRNRKPQPVDFRVDAFKPSLIERLARVFGRQ